MTLERRTRLRRVSPKRKATTAARAEVWEQVQARDRGCLLDGHHGAHQPCRGGLTPHHLQKASQGGPYTVENIVALCAFHNGWVEDYPLTAHVLGLVVRQGETPALAWYRMWGHRLTEHRP